MIRFLLILFIALVPLYLILTSIQPELAWYFGIIVFSLFALYLLYRIPLEIILYKKQMEEEEENSETFGKSRVFYDLHTFRKALKNKHRKK